jgi:branched-chain amino acid transport system permease protein
MIDLLGYGAFFLTTALIFVLISLGLNLQWGLIGLFNVGVAGWLGAMLAAGVAAGITGFATLRLKSDYLAITTFGVGFIPRPFASLAETPFYFNIANLAVVTAVTIVAYLALQHLARGPSGRVLKALREDERAAISLGKNARFYRVQAFAVGGALMGLAGAVHAHFIGFIAPDNYTPMLTFQVWVMLIVGGSGSNRGAVIGSILVWAIWAGSGALVSWLAPPDQQARAAACRSRPSA